MDVESVGLVVYLHNLIILVLREAPTQVQKYQEAVVSYDHPVKLDINSLQNHPFLFHCSHAILQASHTLASLQPSWTKKRVASSCSSNMRKKKEQVRA